jgi:hypothetical protein
LNDDDLIAQFEACALPFAQWTHRTHVKVAYLYLSKFGFERALAQLRTGINAYNAANEVPEGPLTGYNETTTHALLHLIEAVRRAYAATHPVDSADAFYDVHPQLHSKHALRFFYTPQRRIEPEAKATFLEPDLAPLPRFVDPEQSLSPAQVR